MNSTDRYYDDVRRNTTLLTREQETELFKRYQDEGDEKAGEQIVSANLRFVISIARRYANDSVSVDDLISEGNIGLMIALQHFDYKKGYKFISYAVWWIRQRILSYLKENHLVRRPANVQDVVASSLRAHHDLSQKNNREPTHQDIAHHVGVAVDKVTDALNSPLRIVRPDATIDSRFEMERLLSHSEPAVASRRAEDEQRHKLIMETIRHVLTEREQHVVIRSYGLDGDERLTLEEIGKTMHLTRERIRQIREMALFKLKNRPAIKAYRPVGKG